MDRLEEALEIARRHFPEEGKNTGETFRKMNLLHKRFEEWQEQQIAHFLGIVNLSVRDLLRAYDEQMVSTLAWVTRNLLELSVWIDFCCGSDENAKRFQEDAIRDLYGWAKATIEIEKQYDSAEHEKLREKMSELEKLAVSRGLGKLDDDYIKVRAAAKELGREEEFNPRYKMCSKFAHPTAWVVRTASSIESDTDVRELFFMDGVDLAVKSLSAIRTRILFSFPELGERGWK